MKISYYLTTLPVVTSIPTVRFGSVGSQMYEYQSIINSTCGFLLNGVATTVHVRS